MNLCRTDKPSESSPSPAAQASVLRTLTRTCRNYMYSKILSPCSYRAKGRRASGGDLDPRFQCQLFAGAAGIRASHIFPCEICRGASETRVRIEAGQPEDRKRGACARSDWLLSFKLFSFSLSQLPPLPQALGPSANWVLAVHHSALSKAEANAGALAVWQERASPSPGPGPHLRLRLQCPERCGCRKEQGTVATPPGPMPSLSWPALGVFFFFFGFSTLPRQWRERLPRLQQSDPLNRHRRGAQHSIMADDRGAGFRFYVDNKPFSASP
jgi:hypothetical protein